MQKDAPIESLPDIKLYELSLQNKQHQEDRRDNINSYYISLFSAIVAVIPFIDKISRKSLEHHKYYLVKCSLVVLCLIGFILATTWLMNLKRILSYLQAADKFLAILERKHNSGFITYIAKELSYENAPDRITKYQLALPYTFMLGFLFSMGYFLFISFFK
ncbi:MAG: hypothetical protein H0U78_02450 [Rickettsiaceae bacterium]|nr:hypothetical protein [Rickettsiaceae bacterium]